LGSRVDACVHFETTVFREKPAVDRVASGITPPRSSLRPLIYQLIRGFSLKDDITVILLLGVFFLEFAYEAWTK
jgi:hypothetical protein